VLAGMKGLREVLMVVEFGRGFEGEFGFLEMPEWRNDLRWSAERAREALREEWVRRGVGGEEGRMVDVRCVILTRGGEQA
jgi:hypothetical protein